MNVDINELFNLFINVYGKVLGPAIGIFITVIIILFWKYGKYICIKPSAWLFKRIFEINLSRFRCRSVFRKNIIIYLNKETQICFKARTKIINKKIIIYGSPSEDVKLSIGDYYRIVIENKDNYYTIKNIYKNKLEIELANPPVKSVILEMETKF